jgi:hypothetical protein
LRPRDFRILASLVLLGFLVVFFVPILYNPTLFACTNPSALCLTNPSGLESIGFWLFHWGGTYSLEPGWSGPTGGYSSPVFDSLTFFDVILTYAFPLIVGSTALLAPEIVQISEIARIGFVSFGAFVFVSSILFLFSMIPTLVLTGIVLVLTAILMVAYGMRILIFHVSKPS